MPSLYTGPLLLAVGFFVAVSELAAKESRHFYALVTKYQFSSFLFEYELRSIAYVRRSLECDIYHENRLKIVNGYRGGELGIGN